MDIIRIFNEAIREICIFKTSSDYSLLPMQIRGRSVVLRPEGVYEYVERKETAVEKDH